MNQTRLQSLIETVLSTAIGFVVALAAQRLIFPVFGFRPPLHENLAIAAFFTAVSLVRGYAVRRFCNAHLHRLAVWVAGLLARAEPPGRIVTSHDLCAVVRYLARRGFVVGRLEEFHGRGAVFVLVYVPRRSVRWVKIVLDATLPFGVLSMVEPLRGWHRFALWRVRVVPTSPYNPLFEGENP